MTLSELTTLVTTLQELIELNTLAIETLSARFSSYALLSDIYSIKLTGSSNASDITTLLTSVAELLTSIGLVNKFSKLLDVNIEDIATNDILQWDGDRWTNIKPSKLGISTSSSSSLSLSSLSDVSVSSLQDGQALCWDNSSSTWVNKTISSSSSSGSTSSFDEDAMWEALAASTSEQINPTHITGSLNLSGLTVDGTTALNGDTSVTTGSVELDVTTTGVTVNGDLLATGEITAYSV